MSAFPRCRFVGLSTVALLGVAMLAARADEPEPSAKLKERLGEPTVAILKNVTRVEVFRVQPKRPDKPAEKNVVGYTIVATVGEPKKELASKLAAVLLADKTYFSEQSRCFLPGIGFRLWTEKKESVDMVVCLTCTNLRLVSRDADGKEIKSVAGAFGPELQPLLKLVKEAFPDDKEIQKIGEEKKK
jgi:hypothetical protein